MIEDLDLSGDKSMTEERRYAIIETGSKQYRVSENDQIDIELTPTEGKSIAFAHVLFIQDGKIAKIGQPIVPNSKVMGEVIGEVKGPKTIAYKYKKRKNYRRKIGHRQSYLRVKITQIQTG